jgi:integrase/recombinase XerD
MVKVLSSWVRGPLEPHVIGFAEELLRQGYSQSSAGQHVCFIAHLDRWMQAASVELGELSVPVIERYLAERRTAGYVEYRSVKALQPLLVYLAPLGVLPNPGGGPGGRGGGTLGPLSRLPARRAWPERWNGARLRGLRATVRRDPVAG